LGGQYSAKPAPGSPDLRRPLKLSPRRADIPGATDYLRPRSPKKALRPGARAAAGPCTAAGRPLSAPICRGD